MTLHPPGPLPPVIIHRQPSPQHYTKGRTQPISCIVIHNTEGTNSVAWLSTARASAGRASIHVVVLPDGTRYNIVNYADTAFHVGIAKKPYRNSSSLGIEFENPSTERPPTPRAVPYPDVQIAVGAHCVATWLFSYGLRLEDIVRHGDIALPVGRRTDPAYFPLPRFLRLVTDWLTFMRALPESEHHRWIV